jgi:hypothetical protein
LQTSSFVQGVEGVEIRLAVADRIEKRVLRIEGASRSRFKGIAHTRSNRSAARQYFRTGKLINLFDWHDDDPFHHNLWPTEYTE